MIFGNTNDGLNKESDIELDNSNRKAVIMHDQWIFWSLQKEQKVFLFKSYGKIVFCKAVSLLLNYWINRVSIVVMHDWHLLAVEMVVLVDVVMVVSASGMYKNRSSFDKKHTKSHI